MKKRATSHDVAKRAGVSQATVSYVLNGNTKQSISPETRERVLKAAGELAYYPNNAAKVLKNEKTGCIDVVVNKNLNHARYGETVQVLRSALEKRGYRILLTRDTPSGGLPIYVRDFLENKVDGVVYVGADGAQLDSTTREAIKACGAPFVAVDCNEADPEIAAVDIDYAGGVHAAVDALQALGCTQLLYVDPRVDTPQEITRIAAFESCTVQKGLRAHLCTLDFSNYLEEEGRMGDNYNNMGTLHEMVKGGIVNQYAAEVMQLVQGAPRATGIICSWRAMRDILAIAMLEWNPAPAIASLVYEPYWLPYKGALLSERLPNREVSRTAAEMVCAQIDGAAPGHKAMLQTGPILREN